MDLAYAIGVRDRTVERWLAGESDPRLRNVKAMADHWGIELAELRPDLEREERELQAQLDRMEGMLRELIRSLPDALDAGDPEAQRRAMDHLRQLGAAGPSHQQSPDGQRRAGREAPG